MVSQRLACQCAGIFSTWSKAVSMQSFLSVCKFNQWQTNTKNFRFFFLWQYHITTHCQLRHSLLQMTIRSRSCGYSSGFWQNVTGGYPVCQRWKSYSQNINELLKNWFDQSHFLLLSTMTLTWLVLCIDVTLKKKKKKLIAQNCAKWSYQIPRKQAWMLFLSAQCSLFFFLLARPNKNDHC